MAKTSGLGQRLYVGGVDLSGDIGSIDGCSSPIATLDVTGIDKAAIERIGGLRDGQLDFTAFFNTALGTAHPTLSALPTADIAELYCTGTAIGDPAAGLVAKQLNYDGKRGTDGAFTFSVSAQANGFGIEWGRLLTAAVRTDTAATNGSSLDGAASSAFGLQAYLQVTGFTGTSCTVKLQDSPDNVTFTDVTGGGFVAATAAGAQRIATTNVLTVARYLRVATTGTFSSCAFVVMVNRNAIAGQAF